MEVRYIFLFPPVLEEIFFSTPLIRALIKSVENAEIIAAVPDKLGFVLEDNPYLKSQILLDKKPGKKINEFRDINADYLVDLTGGGNTLWFKNRLRVMDFSVKKKDITKARSQDKLEDYFINYTDLVFSLLSVFDLENDGKGIEYFYGHNQAFTDHALPSSFIDNYAVLDFPEMFKGEEVVEPLSKLISMIERPVVLCGSSEWKETGNEVMRRSGCTILNTCGDFSEKENSFLRASANVLISIRKGHEVWSLVYSKPHFLIDLEKDPAAWKKSINEIRSLIINNDEEY